MALTSQQKAAGRKSIPLIKAIFEETPPEAISIALTIVDKKRLTFTAAITAQVGNESVVYDVAANDGKLKKYQDIDSVYRTAVVVAGALFATQAPVVSMISNQAVMLPEESISGDPSEKLAKEKLKLQSAGGTTEAKLVDIGVDIAAVAGYATGTPKEQAYYNELVSQQTVMFQLVAWYAARIAEIDAILTP